VYCKAFNTVCFGHLACQIVSKQTKLAYTFCSYYCWGADETKKFCLRVQSTLATPLVRSAEEYPFVWNANATAAWRRSRKNGRNITN